MNQIKSVTRFRNAHLLRNHAIVEEDLWISNGKIISPQDKAHEEIDASGLLIAPGYVDLQVNGAFGYDFSSQENVVDKVASGLPRFGVTSFLATVVSSDPEQYRRVLPTLQPRPGGSQGAELLGIHLEGPFLNPQYAGAHSNRALRLFERGLASLKECYGSLEGVKLITLAPELPGALEIIQELKKHQIQIAAGHSGATYDEAYQAVLAGVSLVTHLYNAMTPFHHREPGWIGWVLTQKDVYYSLIVDGVHLHPAAVTLAWKNHPEGLILVSDCVAALGSQDKTFMLGKEKITVDQHAVQVAGKAKLAGSAIGLDEAVRRFKKITACTTVEALEAASLKPAKLLGISHRKGHLNGGGDADLIFLDQDLFVKRCYISGRFC